MLCARSVETLDKFWHNCNVHENHTIEPLDFCNFKGRSRNRCKWFLRSRLSDHWGRIVSLGCIFREAFLLTICCRVNAWASINHLTVKHDKNKRQLSSVKKARNLGWKERSLTFNLVSSPNSEGTSPLKLLSSRLWMIKYQAKCSYTIKNNLVACKVPY